MHIAADKKLQDLKGRFFLNRKIVNSCSATDELIFFIIPGDKCLIKTAVKIKRQFKFRLSRTAFIRGLR